MRGNEIRFNKFFTKTSKIPLYIQFFILKQRSNSNIVIKCFHPIPFLPRYSQIRLLTFYSFPFLYFKTFNQGYLIPFHSILFHSFPLLKYITFHSIHLHSLIIILLHSLMNSQTEPQSFGPYTQHIVLQIISLFKLLLQRGSSWDNHPSQSLSRTVLVRSHVSSAGGVNLLNLNLFQGVQSITLHWATQTNGFQLIVMSNIIKYVHQQCMSK